MIPTLLTFRARVKVIEHVGGTRPVLVEVEADNLSNGLRRAQRAVASAATGG